MDVNSKIYGFLTCILQTLLLSSATLQPFDLLYHNGVEAFYKGDYGNVVRYMESALKSFSEVRQTRIRCRLKCGDQHRFDNFLTDKIFEVILYRGHCLNQCIEGKIGAQSMHKVSEDVIQDFNRRIPYNYLQLAYRKLGQLDKAASAAHTYFQANPEHVEMGEDLERYKAEKGVKEEHLIDRESRSHQKAFFAGVKLYDKGNYKESAMLFEEALTKYYRADVECRALCEGPQHFEEQSHVLYKYNLYELISDHYTQVLHCQHECVRDLATRPGRLSPMENYLPLHYDYLQFAYFQAGRNEEALECALTYLLFHEGEEFMTENVEYYKEVLGHDSQPRKEAEQYLRRHKQELDLLHIGSSNLGVPYIEGNYWSSSGGREDANRIPSGTDGWMDYVPISTKKNVTILQELREGGPLLYENVRLVQNSGTLNGSQRVLFDDVISDNECTELKHLAHYGYEGRVPLKSARLFYEVSEKARRIIESYFMLNSTLHFSYTHLVCRTAISGQQDHRNDLSHPIHADNCLLDPEANECWKEPPAYTYRDYSALLYLNGDFDGGEFIFTEMDAKTVTASVKPRCGRMVGFSSGGENPHGVRAVTRGQRCAVALWFTLDPLYRELPGGKYKVTWHYSQTPNLGCDSNKIPEEQHFYTTQNDTLATLNINSIKINESGWYFCKVTKDIPFLKRECKGIQVDLIYENTKPVESNCWRRNRTKTDICDLPASKKTETIKPLRKYDTLSSNRIRRP
ncbi:prolyl 3-hydroxylase 2 [Labeo rohita]|uniref:procollagen-proline 3-dioxygenase n=1 Tax=Labeo rohita TaxID=84645 RepID=A0A498MLC0_LABRO|nr:prolyl 3-hydroxylase 2 [Labeo rohita]